MREFSAVRLFLVCHLVLGHWLFARDASAAEPFIPRKQTKPPTPALSPAQAVAKMTVPPGFTVELVAAEPDVVNPVAMTFDERGRIWITESFEYPRKEPGPGRDRVKILEDTDGDGTAEKVSIFAEGLNIPSGIAVGAGGVWVANAPDILFYPDADRDGRADGPPEQVLTGFGRDDTHELPNSLTWGPDGWLYGLNGVFNASHVRYGKDNAYLKPTEKEKHPGWKITCAMFRIHPRTREFQVFCEGTSNPWGIAFNDNGDAFVSACVIDHLWHLVETGYYHRQGGPYPPHTWKLESIVDYKHQMAAYCGITWFDSDAYPEEFRKKLYMGNIHGGCINVDGLVRHGATYKGVKHDDFLTANDVWFMPVVQKVGPDGCLYILDWYDRYHCYQDANADPKGVDRAKGRLYRVRYKETPRAPKFDLAAETDDQLLQRLASPNIFYREQAQRILAERLAAKSNDSTSDRLRALALDAKQPRAARLQALWTTVAAEALDDSFHNELLKAEDPTFRAWSIRATGDSAENLPAVTKRLTESAVDPSPDVRLQAAIAAGKRMGEDAVAPLFAVIDQSSGDGVTGPVVWQNLKPLLSKSAARIAEQLSDISEERYARLAILSRYMAWSLSRGVDGARDAGKLALAIDGKHAGSTTYAPTILAVDAIARAICDNQLDTPSETALREMLQPRLARALVAKSDSLQGTALELLSRWRHPDAIAAVRRLALDARGDEKLRAFFGPKMVADVRTGAAQWWISSRDPNVLNHITDLLSPDGGLPADDRRKLFDAMAGFDDSKVGTLVLGVYGKLEDELKPAAIELLSSRAEWSRSLLGSIEAREIPKDAVTVNQVRKLLKLGDKELAARVEATWGKLRTDRNPQREQVVAQMRELVKNGHGDPLAGQAVFGRLCGQCHKIHGQGQDVGPDITVNGRSNFEQLLSNIFDPSLVIGAAYQPRIVSTGDGRVLTGLLVEDGPQRVVLKLQGGKLETIPRSNIDEIETSRLSLMPEGVETQYKPQEIIDLVAFLKLDRPPQDPQAKTLPGFAELDKK
jgi:putative heme-binding domain-containing protein